ncbi:MAG: hypothetical protein Alpg2KO_19390 [Alphaproteobacteria bacterium]
MTVIESRIYQSPDDRKSPSLSGEAALVELLERLQNHREGRIAVHLQLSRLRQWHQRPGHMRVAAQAFADSVRHFNGEMFQFRNHDIVYIAKDVTPWQLEDPIEKLRFLFSDDPLTRHLGDLDATEFCIWYRLDRDYDDLMYKARLMRKQASFGAGDLMGGYSDKPAPKPMEAAHLARLHQMLASADLTNVMRNQPVCAIVADEPPCEIFSEMFIAIAELSRNVAPGLNLLANPWLFMDLTRTLDKRVLAHLSHDVHRMKRAFSLNLNVATLLSDDFRAFDQAVAAGLRGRLVLELQMVDILSDMTAFNFARDFVKSRGYRLALDGLTWTTLPLIERQRLGIDLMKMHWAPEIADHSGEGIASSLRDQIKAQGTGRVILTRCDDETAIATGRSLGISLFQGRAVDAQIRSSQPGGNPVRGIR